MTFGAADSLRHCERREAIQGLARRPGLLRCAPKDGLPGCPVAPTPRRDAGFTLIELLVGLAILGLVAGMMLASVGMAGITARRIASTGTQLDEVATAQMLLRGRLQRLQPVVNQFRPDAMIDAEGDAANFVFVAPPLDRDAPDALHRYQLSLAASGEVTLYTLNALDVRADEVAERGLVGWTAIPVLRGASALTLAYFGEDTNNGGRRWQSFWVQHRMPPELVRVRIAFPPGDRRTWPDLVVRPRAAAGTFCPVDPVTGGCEVAS